MDEDELLEEGIDELRICKKINKDLCGEIIKLHKNTAEVRFIPTEKMLLDDNMVVHYGFIFSSASFCALAAVNEPNAMIIYAETKFLSPIELNSEVVFKSHALQSDLKKREVVVEGFLYNIKVYDAIFHIIVFDKSMFKIDFQKVQKV